MGELAKLLSQPTAKEAAPVLNGPGCYSQARVLEKQPETPSDLLQLFGHDPECWAVDGPVSVWHRETMDGQVKSTYRYKLCERRTPLDVDGLVSQAKEARKHRHVGSQGPFWFVYQAGDLQLGKRSRDGSTEEIVSFFLESVEHAVQEFEMLKPLGVAGIQLCFPGDCLEGNVSQGGKNAWLTQETITEQTRIFRRLLMHTVERFAPLVDKVYLDVVNGNHDEAQRQWNTYPGDGWATESAIAVDDALKMNPRAFGHVEVRVPDKWSGFMTVPVGDSWVTVAHGHQWRSGQGLRWWSEQALNNQCASGSQVLQHGHFHTFDLESTRDRVRVQSPTFDCGSDWFRDSHGGDSKRGGLVYLLRGGDVSRISVV